MHVIHGQLGDDTICMDAVWLVMHRLWQHAWITSQVYDLCHYAYGEDLLYGVNEAIITLRPRQNGRHFPVNTFKRIFFKENVSISIKISLNFVPKSPTNNIPALAPTRRQAIIWTNDG